MEALARTLRMPELALDESWTGNSGYRNFGANS